MDPRTPVVVGAGQTTQHPEDPAQAREPIDLLADAARAADADSGAPRSVLRMLDTIAVVDIVSWKYPDPGALVGRRLGIEPRTTMTTTVGGNSPQLLVNELASEIARGNARAVLIGGAECVYTRWRARREPRRGSTGPRPTTSRARAWWAIPGPVRTTTRWRTRRSHPRRSIPSSRPRSAANPDARSTSTSER
ncbi:MAG TPA: hypothetical protein VKB11_04380 [Acidimicrobiia bacterium]|nr:hypothetical protein [Acidimicrobiia bacterium]